MKVSDLIELDELIKNIFQDKRPWHSVKTDPARTRN